MKNRTDYVSPGFEFKDISYLFPNRCLGTLNEKSWPYLRQDILHKWYVDRRQPLDGFINVDETSILVKIASIFPESGLEIGSLRGWSTAHLSTTLKHLDSIDISFSDDARKKEVFNVIRSLDRQKNVRLHSGASPDYIKYLGARLHHRWSFAFIDGDHHGNAPRADAEVVEKYMLERSAIVLHDLTVPAVSEGLRYLKGCGWRYKIYQTMQIMGVAYRGVENLPVHVADPEQDWWVPSFLNEFLPDD